MLIEKLLDSASIQHKYLCDYLINTLGWFSPETPGKAKFKLIFSESYKKRIQHFSKDLSTISINDITVRAFAQRLFCRDTPSPDQEPSPLHTAELDLILNDIQQEIMTFCQQHKIPFLSKMPWPLGHPFALIISHDIDLIRKYGPKILAKELFTANFKRFTQSFTHSVFRDNLYWNFDDLLDFYDKQDIISTFFVIARRWEKLNYRYSINTAKFCQLFEKILKKNHEIGLHSSRFAFDHPKRIMREKKKLERIIGKEITGVRQHYLRLQFPEAWRNFQNAGLHYDSSCGYNLTMGFRAGTSFPFKTFDAENTQILDFYEIPFTVMDYPWLEGQQYQPGSHLDFKDIVNQIENCQGLLHILWHPHNLVEADFKPLWESIFSWLDHKKFYNDSLEQMLKWWKNRAGITLKHLRTDEGYFDFILESGHQINNLCLQVISPMPLVLGPQIARINPENQFLYRVTIKHLKKGTERFRFPFA